MQDRIKSQKFRKSSDEHRPIRRRPTEKDPSLLLGPIGLDFSSICVFLCPLVCSPACLVRALISQFGDKWPSAVELPQPRRRQQPAALRDFIPSIIQPPPPFVSALHSDWPVQSESSLSFCCDVMWADPPSAVGAFVLRLPLLGFSGPDFSFKAKIHFFFLKGFEGPRWFRSDKRS